MLEYLDQFGDTIGGMNIPLVFLRPSLDYQNGENAKDRDNQQERLVRLTRLAMGIECEGCITIGMSPATKTRNRIALYPTIGFTNTDPNMIAEIAETLESNGVRFDLRRSRGWTGRLQRYDFSIHGYERVKAILNLVLPHIRTKKRQAELVLMFVESRQNAAPKAEYSEYDWALCKAVRKLNRALPKTRAVVKAKAALESSESIRQPRTLQYLKAYVKMCAELQRELESTAEMTVPPILKRWVKK